MDIRKLVLFWTADISRNRTSSTWINVDIALLSWQNILVPDSLITFLRDRLEEEKRMKAISPGSVSKTADGEIILIKPDLEEVDGWERILKIAVNFKQCSVTDQEVLEFPFLEGCDMDRLRSVFKLSRSQIDAMILAKREKAVYVCDDLFLRKIGSACGITCNNSLFLLKALYQKNPVQAAKVLKKISKSDYNAVGERLIIDV